ncbi:MAG: formyltetrahydrofolate deformylase [Kineosporiaceae bacterium]
MTAGRRRYILTLSCPDRVGIVHAVTGALLRRSANVTESTQFGDPDTRLFFMRVEFEVATGPDGLDATESALRAAFRGLEAEFGLTWQLHRGDEPVRTIIMVSTAGHCLTNLLYRHRDGRLPIDPVAVVSNHTDLAGLADFYGVPFHHVPVTRESRPAAEAELLRLVTDHRAELVVLARYMQILSAGLCDQLAGRVVNIHHSFLPSFAGARPYHQAYERGVKLIGATAHYATADLDEGPIIEQDVERVTHAQTPAELVDIGHDVESRVLTRAVRWHAERRVLLDGRRTVVFR